MRLVLCAAALVAFASPAAAFDNTTCKTFLVGTWDGTREHDMGGHKAIIATHSVYKDDGTFTSSQTMEMPGQAPMAQTFSGTWDAKPGPTADTCETSITMTDTGTQTVVLTVIDENTVKGPTGNISSRVVEP